MTASITFAQATTLLQSHKAAARPEIIRALTAKTVFGYDQKTHDFAVSLGLDIPAILTAPQKQVMRAIQILNCVNAGLVGELDYTHTRILIAMRAAGDYDLHTDAIAALAANKIQPGTETRGVTRGQVNALFARSHGISTVKTKVSNSVGKNGYMSTTGMTQRKGSNNAAIALDKTHPLTVAFFAVIDNATTGQLKALSDKGEKLGD